MNKDLLTIHYVSPSLLPSRSANSVHVINQCQAFLSLGCNVILYAKRTVKNESHFHDDMVEAYGTTLKIKNMVTFFSRFSKGDNLRIAILAIVAYHRSGETGLILSRNLYASFWLAFVEGRPLLFETHQLESGVKKWIQRMIMTRKWVKTIVISNKLKQIMTDYHGVAPTQTLVLHDAAPDDMHPLDLEQRRPSLISLIPDAIGAWDGVCGYFGHLYEGRGIEIIESMAKARPGTLFVVFGGTQSDISYRRKMNRSQHNIYFGGHVSHSMAQNIMRTVDVLLMPYQAKVAIGAKGHDTGRWMSPMKMFEYMSTGVPIISSDLPVLREVLKSGENAILVSASSPNDWCAALDRILSNHSLAVSVASKAYKDYSECYTWRKRAQIILQAASE